MQWTAVFLLGFSLHLGAKGLSQSMTLKANNVPLKTIFTEIKKQTGFVVLSNQKVFEQARPVSIEAENVPLEKFLILALKDQPLEYSISGNTVMIGLKKAPAEKVPTVFYPPITVRGKVVNEKGEPVVASVVIKGTKIGVTTDGYGSFELLNVPDNATLVISGITIETQEVKVNGKTEINISTITRIADEEEVTISTGYISSTKLKSTANISKVSADQIETQPVTSPLMSLQGRVAGLEISPITGIAGSASRIRIRGENSIRGLALSDLGNQPLYVIDGIPIDARPLASAGDMLTTVGIDPLASLPASNIESIEILKDGAATGIYGTRGANGVILITTKKGKQNGKTNLELNYYTGVGKVPHFIDMLNTKDYLQMRREAITNGGSTIGDFDFDINGTWDTTRNVNWQKELLGKTARINDAQLFLSAGNAQTNIRIGGNFHKETTIYPGDFGYRNISGTANITHTTLDNRFRMSLNINYANNLNKIANSSTYVTQAIILAPNAPKLYDENGDINWEMVSLFGGTFSTNTWTNPLTYLYRTQDIKTQNLLTNLTTEYQISNSFQFKANFGFNTLQSDEVSKTPIKVYPPYAIGQYTVGAAKFVSNKRQSWSVEPQLVYNKMLSQHTIKLIAGTALQQANFGSTAIRGEGYQSDLLLNSIQGAPQKFVENDVNDQYRYAALFAAAHYEYDNKYIVDVNFRRDGSSRFGSNKQYGNFGGIGAAWLFSNEKFFNHSQVFSHGKLRASYAITGNDQIEDYKYYASYTVGFPYAGIPSLYADALSNKDLGWESTRKAEVGIELGFFRNRIFLDVVHYRNRSSNQLITFPLPGVTGFVSILKNFEAEVENSGWEAQLSTKIITKKNFNWSASFNISIPKNKLVAFPNVDEYPGIRIYKLGASLNIKHQYHFTGVDPATGQYTFEDVDKNGVIDQNDNVFTYSTDKKFYGGLYNNFRYRSFELSFLWQFSNQPGNKLLQGPAGPSWGGNQPVYVMQRWRKPGDNTDVQQFTTDFTILEQVYNAQSSDYMKVDASFVRLKTLNFAWTLPQRWLDTGKIAAAKIFVQGQNLITITDYEGFDPETGSTSLPPLRMITAGFQLNF